jgi:hypothetical protein
MAFRSFFRVLFSLILLSGAGIMASAQAQGFAAFAIGNSGSWGYANNFDDISTAQDRAVEECSKHGSGCRILRVFQNTCAALAVHSGRNNNFVFYWLSVNDRDQLRGAAMNNCRRDGGERCQVLTDFCSRR